MPWMELGPGCAPRLPVDPAEGECAGSAAADTGEAVQTPQRPLSSSGHKGTHTAAAFHGGIAACCGVGEGKEIFS